MNRVIEVRLLLGQQQITLHMFAWKLFVMHAYPLLDTVCTDMPFVYVGGHPFLQSTTLNNIT